MTECAHRWRGKICSECGLSLSFYHSVYYKGSTLTEKCERLISALRLVYVASAPSQATPTHADMKFIRDNVRDALNGP